MPVPQGVSGQIALKCILEREAVTVYYRGRPRALITPLAARAPGSAGCVQRMT